MGAAHSHGVSALPDEIDVLPLTALVHTTTSESVTVTASLVGTPTALVRIWSPATCRPFFEIAQR
jgi:hypothetical protein